MKLVDPLQIKALQRVGMTSRRIFIVLVIASVAITVLGSIISGLLGLKQFITIIFAISGFVASIACFSMSVYPFTEVLITVIELRFDKVTPRTATSSFISYGFAFLLATAIGISAFWWGLECLINPERITSIK